MDLVLLPFLCVFFGICVSPISVEVITLKNNDKIKCVVTEESLQSFIFLRSEDSLVGFDFERSEYDIWDYNNSWYNKSVSYDDNFEPNVDERWMLTKKKSDSQSIKLENRLGYACLTNLSSLTVLDSNYKKETDIMKVLLRSSQYPCGWYSIGLSKENSTNNVKNISLQIKSLLNNAQPIETKIDFDPKYLLIKNESYVLEDKYAFFYSNKTDLKGSYFNLNSSDDCISMYVSVNIQCYLNITLETTNNTVLNSTVINGTNLIDDFKKWQIVEIQSDYEGKKTLYFRRGQYDNKLDGYWAVDYIQKCKDKPIYWKNVPNNHLRENYICERFSSTPINFSKPCHRDNASFIDSKCTISCSEILGESYPNCQKHSLCVGTVCVCAWGYKGPNCNQTCEDKQWGLNCSETCSNRCKSCNNTFGCSEELPVVLHPPKLLSLEKSVSIEIDLTYSPNETKPDVYVVQQKECDGKNFKNYTKGEKYKEGIHPYTLKINRNICTEIRVLLIHNNTAFEENIKTLKIYKHTLNGHIKNSTLKLEWTKFMSDVEYQLSCGCLEKNSSNITTANTSVEIKIDKNISNCYCTLHDKSNGNLIDEVQISLLNRSSDVFTVATISYIAATVAAVVLFAFICCLYKFNRCKFKQSYDVPSVTYFDLKEKENLLYNNNNEIELENFEQYLFTSLDEDVEINAITEQFENIPFKKITPCDDARKPENEKKNRYTSVLPYDDTRVVLIGNESDDYINANFIDGYNAPKKFIATQYPLPSSDHDFWHMIWQEKVEIIVMLASLEAKSLKQCKKYWPQYRLRSRVGKFLLENVYEKVTPSYICRKIQINCDDAVRFVQHLHYTMWPDHSIPISVQNFTNFIKEVRLRQGRTVVHCSAGCGRTGTYILCDIAISMANDTKKVNLVSILERLREQRVGLVGNVNQYVFAHFVILEFFFGEKFAIPVEGNFRQKLQDALKEIPLFNLMQRLEKYQHQFEKTQIKIRNQLTDEDKLKNRFPTILPGQTQIFLPSTTHSTSTYINAVSVNCYRYPKKFIVTQQPLENTILDFWTLCKDQEVDTILSLNQILEGDPLCPIFWPTGDQEWLIGIMDTITFVAKDDTSDIYDNIQVKICKQGYKQIVNIFHMKNWKRETTNPKNIKDLIDIWKKSLTNGKIIVTCYDGALASGLFVAMAYMFENINMDHVCDVYSAIKAVRESRYQFVQHPDQIKFLYRAAYEYVREFSIYENFSPLKQS